MDTQVKKIIVATGNEGKMKEIRQILGEGSIAFLLCGMRICRIFRL